MKIQNIYSTFTVLLHKDAKAWECCRNDKYIYIYNNNIKNASLLWDGDSSHGCLFWFEASYVIAGQMKLYFQLRLDILGCHWVQGIQNMCDWHWYDWIVCVWLELSKIYFEELLYQTKTIYSSSVRNEASLCMKSPCTAI